MVFIASSLVDLYTNKSKFFKWLSIVNLILFIRWVVFFKGRGNKKSIFDDMFLVMKLKTELSKVLQEEKMQRKNKDDFLILTFFVSFFCKRPLGKYVHTFIVLGGGEKRLKINITIIS